MIEIIAVSFRNSPKSYYFSPGEEQYHIGDRVVVETSRGQECGKVCQANREVPEEEIPGSLKTVLRRATPKDLEKVEQNRKKEQEAFQIAKQKIAQHNLKMKLVEVEYAFDGSKILFFFTADGRVDFRELVKDLAGVFRTRIELRQIGVRDEAKLLGGLGICGRPFCCASFLGDFQPVSIKMAKEQALSLNPTKISGTCGRLMCCLKYEQSVYDELIRLTPRVGAMVDTPEGRGRIVESNVLTGDLKVRLEEDPSDTPPKSFHRDEVAPAGKGAPVVRTKPETEAEEEVNLEAARQQEVNRKSSHKSPYGRKTPRSVQSGSEGEKKQSKQPLKKEGNKKQAAGEKQPGKQLQKRSGPPRRHSGKPKGKRPQSGAVDKES